MGPTVAAVALYYAASTPPAQSSAMTLSATLHSLCAARAARNLESFCSRLPVSWRTKVANGSMLDQDTLARIAGHIGAYRHPDVEIQEYGVAHNNSPNLRGGDSGSIAPISEPGHSPKLSTSRMAWLQEAFTGFAPSRVPSRTHQMSKDVYTSPRRASTGGPTFSSAGGIRVEASAFQSEKESRRSPSLRSPKGAHDLDIVRQNRSAPGISIVTQRVETEEVLYNEGAGSASASAYSEQAPELSPRKF
ncbi:hypothetical protein CBOM_06452 [Ceraceosorus bombacis]|uniref:Uncharacterized protein n=1 Tax=Ceraceosorus bombacis TaxID=401625 RepID=A0A0P1BL53_9BASI|nr:hypothetical protein CBOM_06452 [Ceraceosorus bombacis]